MHGSLLRDYFKLMQGYRMSENTEPLDCGREEGHSGWAIGGLDSLDLVWGSFSAAANGRKLIWGFFWLSSGDIWSVRPLVEIQGIYCHLYSFPSRLWCPSISLPSASGRLHYLFWVFPGSLGS